MPSDWDAFVIFISHFNLTASVFMLYQIWVYLIWLGLILKSKLLYILRNIYRTCLDVIFRFELMFMLSVVSFLLLYVSITRHTKVPGLSSQWQHVSECMKRSICSITSHKWIRVPVEMFIRVLSFRNLFRILWYSRPSIPQIEIKVNSNESLQYDLSFFTTEFISSQLYVRELLRFCRERNVTDV
jgi:hypothetical protein